MLRVLPNAIKTTTNANRRISLAETYFALGDNDDGFKALEVVFDNRIVADLVTLDPLLDSVRGDPRMQKLVARLQLP